MPTNKAFSKTHKQASASNQWTIEHGMNAKPTVFVTVMYEGIEQAIIPSSIQYQDLNTVIIGFSQPFTGTARLV